MVIFLTLLPLLRGRVYCKGWREVRKKEIFLTTIALHTLYSLYGGVVIFLTLLLVMLWLNVSLFL